MKRARGLSKSKLLSWLQCPKRLWLEVHKPEAAQYSAMAEKLFSVGHSVGAVAQRLYSGGILIESQENLSQALAVTARHIEAGTPILFEPTFQHDGVLVRADILKRKRSGGYEMREVKASTSVKDYHVHDAAIQAWVLAGAGVPVATALIQHIDTSFVYPGGEDYRGLFAEACVDADIRPLRQEVAKWVGGARITLAGGVPERKTGKHCYEPFECSCLAYCSSQEPQTEYPLDILPYIGRTLPTLLAEGYFDVRDLPPERLTNETQELVRRVTRSGKPELLDGAKKILRSLPYPRYYFDFETIGFPVPMWAGTRPYQQIPFQWSCHIERRQGQLERQSFLDVSGDAPMEAVAKSLIEVLGDFGPVLAYNAGFEKGCIGELARMLPGRAEALRKINERFVDLLPLTRSSYYHPAMKGSWSLKVVLPTIAPELSYDNMEGVRDGSDAQNAYLEIIAPDTSEQRKGELNAALERYCERDTLALVRLVEFLVSEKYRKAHE